MADRFQLRFLDEMKPGLVQARDDQLDRRKRIDTARNAQFAPLGVIDRGVNKAKNDIAVITRENYDQYVASGCLRKGVRTCLNSAMYFAYGERSYPGRPGELELMQRSTFAATLADPANWYFKVANHKTKRTSGEVGRIIAEELRDEWNDFVKFTPVDRDQLFVPARMDTGIVQLSKLSQLAGKVYTTGYQCSEPTLRRKHIESKIASKRNRAKAAVMWKKLKKYRQANKTTAMMARAAGHAGKTGRKHYILESGDPEQDAAVAKAYRGIGRRQRSCGRS